MTGKARRTIALIGAGQIGGTMAHLLVEKELGDVILFDVVEGFPQGKALDLMQMRAIGAHDVRVTGTNSWHVGLWNYSANPDDAARLVRFLTASPEVALDYTEQHGQLPAHTAALLNIQESPKYLNMPKAGMRLATYEAANSAVTRGRTPAFLEFEEIVNNSFEDIRNGGDPMTVLEEAELRIDSAMRRYR